MENDLVEDPMIEAKLKAIEEIKKYVRVKNQEDFYETYSRKSLGDLICELNLHKYYSRQKNLGGVFISPGIYPKRYKRF